jgi:2''-5'' RNA ligase
MKYYLVALFDKNSYSYIEEIQKNICKKYKIYKNMPMLHITLEVIGDPDVEKLNKIISDMIRPYKKFKVEINGAICFDPPYKSVNLKIENKGYVIRLARQLNDTLKLHGFDVRDNIDNWDLHVSLANTNHAIREWSSKEYVAACQNAKKEDIHKMVKIDRIELWKPINNKREMVVKSFLLKDF